MNNMVAVLSSVVVVGEDEQKKDGNENISIMKNKHWFFKSKNENKQKAIINECMMEAGSKIKKIS